MTGKQLESNDVANFIFAGKARVTLVSETTGARFTFRVQKDDIREHFFVSLLRGPDNSNDYVYMGLVRANRAALVPTKATKVTNDAPSWKAFAWLVHRLHRGQPLNNMQVWHEGKCGKCGRPLTVPASIANGIGPECSKNMAKGKDLFR